MPKTVNNNPLVVGLESTCKAVSLKNVKQMIKRSIGDYELRIMGLTGNEDFEALSHLHDELGEGFSPSHLCHWMNVNNTSLPEPEQIRRLCVQLGDKRIAHIVCSYLQISCEL